MTPILFQRITFLIIIYVLQENEKNLSLKSLNILVPDTMEFPFPSFSFCCMTVSNASSKVTSHKRMATLGIIYAADPLVQNVTNIVGLR